MCGHLPHVLVVVFSGFIIASHALNCKTEGGLKEDNLRNIYMNCLKKQEQGNSSSSRKYSDRGSTSDNDEQGKDSNIGSDRRWSDKTRHDQGSSVSDRGWDDSSRQGQGTSGKDRGWQDNMRKNQGSGGSGWSRQDDKFASQGDWGRGEPDWSRNSDRVSSKGDWSGNQDETSGRGGMMASRDMGMSGSNNRMSSSRGHMGGSDDFMNDEYGSEASIPNNYRTSTTSTRRFRRDKSMNSGHRSQYNPNTSRRQSSDEAYKDERNSSENNTGKDEDHNKACALHCFMEELQMIGENGMPDRFSVSHVITKDVKNEDFKDFLQESIDECFQVLFNENTQDKCEYSKNLLVCLSEKGRANCDDWKDRMRF